MKQVRAFGQSNSAFVIAKFFIFYKLKSERKFFLKRSYNGKVMKQVSGYTEFSSPQATTKVGWSAGCSVAQSVISSLLHIDLTETQKRDIYNGNETKRYTNLESNPGVAVIPALFFQLLTCSFDLSSKIISFMKTNQRSHHTELPAFLFESIALKANGIS